VKVLEVLSVHNKVAGFTCKDRHDVHRNVRTDASLGLKGGGANVGGAVEVFVLEKRVIGVHGFNFKHVESSRGKRPGGQRLDNSVFVHNTSTSAVDDVVSTRGSVQACLRHGGETSGVHEMEGFVREVAMNGDVGAIGKESINRFVKTRVLGFRNFWWEVRVVGVDDHTEGLSDLTDRLCNSSKPDEAECFSREF